MKKSLIAFSIAMASSAAVSANEHPTMEAFLGLDASHHHKDLDVDTTVGGDLGLSYSLGKDWAIEAWYSRANGELTSNDDDATVENAGINALRYFTDGDLRTFFTIGASQLMINPDNANSSDNLTVDLGVGFKDYFDNNLVLRGDVIGRFFENNSGDLTIDPTVRLSLGYAFGRKASTKSSAPAPVVEAAPKAETPVAPKDSDNDGVYDANDQCPDTASNLKVDENGCPIVLAETVKIDLNIKFPNNSDEILDEYLPEIRSVADFMRQYEGTVVEINGYTDDRGAASYNQQLSEKRAQAVASVLTTTFGVDASRVKAVGLGEANPIADNATAEGRAANRRVVAEVSTRVEKTVEK